MHVAILIKILLEITLFDFMFTTRGSNNCVFLDESKNNMQCFQTNFFWYQYLANHLVKIYEATLNLVKLENKI